MIRPALFCIAAATLMLELLLTRVFDVILTPNLAYMVIACALFSFGLAGVYVTLRPARDTAHVPLLCALFGVASLALLPVLNALPFDYERFGDQPIVQLVSFAVMYLALVVPFFLSGLVFTLLFSANARAIQSLYCWDLAGAAAGCAVMVPLLGPIGPGGILFAVGACGLLAGGLLARDRRWLIAAAVTAAALVAIPAARSPRYFEFVEHLAKRGVKEARLEGRIEFSRWDPISKIDVIEQRELDPATGQPKPFTVRKHIAYDGGTQSSHVFPFDGDYARLRHAIEQGSEPLEGHFWHRGVLASHFAKRDNGQKVLVIGSAGGQETKAALMYGASSVDAVEMVRTVVELVHGPYADYGGRIFLDPRVHSVAMEGRSFLRASSSRYDIIQIHSNHTSSSVAAGTGAMSPNYLQTADAYRDYFSHLTDDGILHINHHVFPRMVTTAALAWRQMGRTDFQRHVVVLGMATERDSLPTFLIRMRPWTEAEVADLMTLFAIRTGNEFAFNLLQDPLHPERSFLPPVFFEGSLPDEVLAKAGSQVRPTTDNRPFFNFLRRRPGVVEASRETFTDPATAYTLNSQLRKNVVPMDVIHLIVTGAVSLLFAGIFLVLPLLRSRMRRSSAAVKSLSVVYFACLGAGFILIELVFIQVFMKLVGYPVYTYVLVIATLLLGAGLGSAASEGLGISPRTRWSWPFIAVIVYGALLVAIYPAVFEHYLSAPDATRMLVSAVLIAPLGFALGMPFPLGILLAQQESPEAVAWGWGLNGLFTVMGSLASVLLGIAIGFQATILVAVGLYAIAFAAFAALRHAVRAPATEAADAAPAMVAVDVPVAAR